MPDTNLLTVRLDAEFHAALMEAARAHGVPVSQIVREALTAKLAEWEAPETPKDAAPDA